MSTQFERYGLIWPGGTPPLQIELDMIKHGGRKNYKGQVYGKGLFYHYKEAMTLMWPEDDWHRWADLAVRTFAENTITVLMGPSDCGKTYPTAKWILTEYWADPYKTLGLVSSTDVRGLELRVWGQIKLLFNRARDRHPWLAGTVLESMRCIATDEIAEEERGEKARVLNRGIICIPCLQGGRYVGLGKYHGIKSPKLRQASDECQLMGPSHLDAIPNYLGKDYKAAFLGNPIETTDPLGRIAEPENGWDSQVEPTKTTTWKTRINLGSQEISGTCVNFVGTDAPNFDFPDNEPIRYPYMTNRRKIEGTAALFGRDSLQYYSQCIGVMKTGLLSRRVITRQLCREHHALEPAVWSGEGERKKIYAIDAAYSGTGGDRCVGGSAEFGESIDGIQILRIRPPSVIPVSIRIEELPEDQIARYVKRDIELLGINPKDVFYDSTGRGTLGPAFSRIFGVNVPVPVEFGGRPSKRPVRHDLFVIDQITGEKRHKRCDEHYYDFVSELWFTARYVIECDQMRELSEEVMREGCTREYGLMPGNKIFVESKHREEFRKKMARSPDLFDWLVTIIEGARQRGFKIQKLGLTFTENNTSDWMSEESELYESEIAKALLKHA